MRDYENDYPDFTQGPDWEHGDEIPSNTSNNRTFFDVIEARASRRGFLVGGIAAAVTGMLGVGVSTRGALALSTAESALLGFTPVPVSEDDAVHVPAGYRTQPLGLWGDPISGNMPAYHGANTGEEQGHQIGQHHDGMHFFPIEGTDPYEGSSEDGLYVVNHEYIEPRFLHADKYAGMELDVRSVVYQDGKRDDDEVLKEINAHGVAIFRIQKQESGDWAIIEDPRNRRITGNTPMEIGGPVRGSQHVVTRYSPDGTLARGTLNNCAHGVTPWNTYLTCEENWAGYFSNTTIDDQKPDLPREHSRYGVSTAQEGGRYGWHLAAGGADDYVRFDATTRAGSPAEDYRNEPNTFGWVVEIDPFNPESTPIKRTHLGRFAHEGVVFGRTEPGKPIVAYAGDDARFEYIYKFVSRDVYEPGVTDGSILDHGTLYVARFNDDGSGEWLALAPGRNGLTRDNGFEDLADILVNTRLAADVAGATKMDRPEWGAVDPATGEVYFTLTNNTRRIEAQVNPANPRAGSQFGHIIRWRENRDDPAATGFSWDLFVLAGDVDSSRTFTGHALNEDNIFACPDGLWFDKDSRLWIQTDIGESAQNRGDLEPMGNNAMLAADPRTGEIRRFLTGPTGQEVTGVCTTPDQRTMFIGLQHPGATTTAENFATGEFSSHWPDGGTSVPRSGLVVVTREDGGIIGA
ncbi:MAG: PhoX family phosphatase [Rhodobacteraceae bacterium]|nr:MAG: PhoX family phosphatase [Paracoccaceae bacterium]